MTIRRRTLVAAAPALLAGSAFGATDSFQAFLTGMRAEARRAGISQATLDAAFAGVWPNSKVLERDRKQPEFSMTWARYRSLLVTDERIANGRIAVAQNRTLLARVRDRFGVASSVICGIWGLESGFGAHTGDFRVVEALATLAWEGRRAGFFRGELMAALKIVEQGNVQPARMTGSYAGAMGQPQFMPSSYLSYAVDFDGDGRKDIWNNRADVFGSIANYLARSGWRSGDSWGQQVVVPVGFDQAAIGRDRKQPLGALARQGVRPFDGVWAADAGTQSAIVAPDGIEGDAFIVFPNFQAIRRYNPSDFYALAVGLIGDRLDI
jgi:membrane-bound lytic murein transglycosylase B